MVRHEGSAHKRRKMGCFINLMNENEARRRAGALRKEAQERVTFSSHSSRIIQSEESAVLPRREDSHANEDENRVHRVPPTVRLHLDGVLCDSRL
jgi:hypothetical protein